MKIIVLDADTLDFTQENWEPLNALCDLICYGHTAPEETVERAKEATIVLSNKVILGRDEIDQLPNLKMIGVLATGYNNVDIEAARQKDITVCNVPAYSNASVVQHTLALLLELCNHVGLHNQSVHTGDWVASSLFSYWKKPIMELTGRKVGIIGYGSIGASVGDVLHTLGAEVIGYSPSQSRTPTWQPFRWADIEEIFSTADAISLHCPQTPENTGFVNAELLARMKQGALLVNTGRGGLINEADLAQALRSGHLGGAALDVVSKEPMHPDCPFLGIENCIITPHIAWSSLDSRERLLAITCDNIKAFQEGAPVNVVN